MKEIRYPSDWQSTVFGDICYINKKSLSEKTPENYTFRYIDLSSVDKGVIKCINQYMTFKDAPCRARRIIHKDDIIMSTVRPNLQGFAFVDFDPIDVICSTGFAVLTAKKNTSNKYIYQLLYSREIETQINNMLVGSNYPAINSSDVASLKVFLPPIKEQEKIAEILGTWDRAIEELTGLIGEKKELRKGLANRLLNGLMWQDVELSDLLNYEQPTKYLVTEILDYDVQKIPVLTANKAFILGSTDDTIGVYSKQDCIIFDDFTTDMKYVDFNFKVKSSAIKILTPKENVNLKFVFEQMQRLKLPIGGHKRYWLSEYQYLTIKMPNEDTQSKIVSILSKADSEIDLLNQQLAVLKEQKRGLMQKLLTGEIRVKVDTETC